MNLEEIHKIYFVGVGGIAMSAVACIAKQKGFEVLGSDSKEVYSPSKDVLDNAKINYTIGYSIDNVKNANADLYVLSAGEDTNNPEVKYIIDNNLNRSSFPELMYQIAEKDLRVVVAGTHGKSTTTGLIGHMLKNLDDSSFMSGAVLQNYQTNFYLGEGHYFVFEGDEYKSQFDDPTPKFQYYNPDILILNNLEYDHPDLFSSFEEMEQEFRLLIEKVPEDGLIIYNADDANLTKLLHEYAVSKVSFGIDNEADFKVEHVSYGTDFTTLEVHNKFSNRITSKLLGQTEQYKIQLPGKINVYNAVAVIATLRALGFPQDQISLDLLSYKGVKRRFEQVGVKNGVILIDDYAHHPTAVKETIEAAKLKFPNSKIWAVFEPHTFSRTKATLEDLVTSFDHADEVVISEIYPAREKASSHTITTDEVIEEIKKHNLQFNIHNSLHKVSDKNDALNLIKNNAKPTNVVIVMAVGNFNRLAYELKEVL